MNLTMTVDEELLLQLWRPLDREGLHEALMEWLGGRGRAFGIAGSICKVDFKLASAISCSNFICCLSMCQFSVSPVLYHAARVRDL